MTGDALLDALDALAERFAAKVAAALAELRPAPQATGPLTRRQLAAALNLSMRTLIKLDAEGLPGTGTGRLRRYDLTACRAWLDARGRSADEVAMRQRADQLLARGRRSAGGSTPR